MRIHTLLVVVALLAHGRAGLGQESDVDFVRGDANNDGVVTISDVHRIRVSLIGSSPQFPGFTCTATADANDDGRADRHDWWYVFDRVACGCMDLVSPFPDPGPDLTANETELSCESYGGGGLLDDPQATFRVLDAFGYGDIDGTAHITLGFTSSRAVAAYSATLRVPDFVTGIVDDLKDETGRTLSRRVGATLRDGRLHLAFMLNATLNRAADADGGMVPPGEGMPAVTIELCLAEGTAAGAYPIEIEAAELADLDTGKAIRPELVGGTLEVFQDVTGDVGCAEEPPPPPPPAPPLAFYALADVEAEPGQEITVPFTVRALEEEIRGLSFSIDYDETLLDLVRVDRGPALTAADAPGIFFEELFLDRDDENPGSAGIDEGFVVGYFALNFLGPGGPESLSPGIDHPIYELIFLVHGDVTAASTEIAFRDGGQGLGEPVFNRATIVIRSEDPETNSSIATFSTEVASDVIPEGSVFNRNFLRGDSNEDLVVDISDPILTLGHLYLGGYPLDCPDAADADDNGALEITDAIYSLTILFIDGSQRFAPPTGSPGKDPTEDDLDCPFLSDP